MAKEAVRFVGDGLTGFDCAGQEERFPDPLLFADAFDVARAGGLGITCHAGEWGGAPQIWRALEVRSVADRPRPGRDRRPAADG